MTMILDFNLLADMLANRLRGYFAHDEVLDTRGAAKLLLVSESTALKWAAQGVIPGRKLDGRWRFRRSTLLNFIGDPSLTRVEVMK